ncbi:MAG: hypothetical protein QOF87_3218 [Pseudonocardiales bacterium]|nr:hypothetical protein [Pseudonocardiales bacterium]
MSISTRKARGLAALVGEEGGNHPVGNGQQPPATGVQSRRPRNRHHDQFLLHEPAQLHSNWITVEEMRRHDGHAFALRPAQHAARRHCGKQLDALGVGTDLNVGPVEIAAPGVP